jgi:DNA-binding CsgD family transcriptional regulator
LQAATLALAIDTLAWPLLLLHGDGELLHANRAAATLLRRGHPLRLTHQRVQPSDEAQRSAFRAALAAVLEGAAPVRLHWAGDEDRAAASARLSALRPDPGQEPVLMLTLAPEAGLGADLTAYAAAHGLSATETRVLQRLALGESSARAAAALGLRATTVRTHALSLRRKTGHASLGALVHALARLAPIAPSSAHPG